MAKRRKGGFRRRARRAYARVSSGFRRFKRRGRRSSRGGSLSGGGAMGILVGGAVYGAGREWASNQLQPVLSKLPGGDLADELGMATLAYFVAKGKVPIVNKIPYSKEIGRAGLTIEAARVGAYLGSKYMPNGTNSSPAVSW